ELLAALQNGGTHELVAALNRYMTYGTQPAPQQVLELWTDLGVERRRERVHGQVAIGAVKTSELRVQRSLSVANHPDPSIDVPGAQFYLTHPRSEASFRLSPDVLNLLRGGRSYRRSDRHHTDLEW